jgi:molybdopterin/thiamine biosynthesis adenylyltransferase
MDYSRQQMIEGLTVPRIVSVVGCGGTGFWTALLLAMQGTDEIILFDDDVIEDSNRARLPVGLEWVGHTKIEALTSLVYKLGRRPRIEAHGKINDDSMLQYLRGIVFCCTDNIPSQQKIWSYCKKNNMRYQRIGYDGTTLCVTESFPMTLEDPNSLPAGYETTPSWVVPCVIAAASGISSQCLDGGKITLMDDIRRLHIQDCSNMAGNMALQLRKEGERRVTDNPGNYGLGDCDNCDRSDCGNCERIPDDDYSRMRDIVCDDCDYTSPEDMDAKITEAEERATNDILDMIRSGNVTAEFKTAIEANYVLKPTDIPGQMKLDDLNKPVV